MANYAYVENEIIQSVYDNYPPNWRNISNFEVFVRDYPDQLNGLGWYTLVKVIPEYNPATQKLDTPFQYFENGIAYESYHVYDNPQPEPPEPEPEPTPEELLELRWAMIRQDRDNLMNDFAWRYERYDRQVRLNIEPTDNLAAMDAYMQALADITLQPDPYNIIWPSYNP
jgi:hypothetical protein